MLTLPNRRIGDAWFHVHDEAVHAFYLVCPDSVPLHSRWDIGHSTSTDLVHWQDHGVVLRPGPRDAWDGESLATGSVIEFEGRFFMAYTGNFSGPNPGLGLAVSDDLFNWTKQSHEPFALTREPTYSNAPNLAWKQPRWRDPYLFAHDAKVYCLVTAAHPDGPPETQGAVAVLRTADMQTWETLPPLDTPRLCQDMECPKLIEAGGRFYLVFSAMQGIMGEDFLAAQPAGIVHGTSYCLVADRFQGPYRLHGSGRIFADARDPSPYANSVIRYAGKLYALGTLWEHLTERPDAVSDPVELEITEAGLVEIDR